MGILQWRQEYNTGVATYDAQHQALFAQANRLYHLIETFERGHAPRVRVAFHSFVDLVHVHARTEEELMGVVLHPGAETHAAAHAGFLQLMEAVLDKDDFDPGGHTGVLEVLARFRRHFEDDDEQSFLGGLRRPEPPALP